MKIFTKHLNQNLIVKMMKIKIKKTTQQQYRHKATKGLCLFKKFKSRGKNLMDETEDAEDAIDVYKLAFIGSNREKFNFNIFGKSLNFLSAIYNGEITLKWAEILQRDFDKKKLKFNYKAKNIEEKEEIDKVLMHANDLLKYRDKFVQAFKDGTFSSEHLKKSDGAAHSYMLENVNGFIQKIKSMSENINLSFFNEFFELSTADYAKELTKVKDPDENKEIVVEIKDRISDLKDRIKEMN